MEKKFSPHLDLAKSYWKAHLTSGDLAIDATCGNGQDTHFLNELCSVVGIDIQPQAIENTRILVPKAELYLRSHAEIDQLPLAKAPQLIVYNLGYLPKGDKSITTRVETTLISLQKSLALVGPGGAISVMCYPGHEEGALEEEAILQLVKDLPSHLWHICHHVWVNRPKSPTFLWVRRVLKT